ncbi:hypothetical protein [Dactylosporangium sp. NPDC051484]|uniref:hypothetical protein n=1 Tax=Dactylosporangium sp. NPDC051484 TaxID=3154942 RepID=UPI00344FB125
MPGSSPRVKAPAVSQRNRKRLIDAIWVGVVIVVMLLVFAYCSQDSGDGVAVDQADAQAVAADLARASAVHGICYGWQLLDSTTPVSSGSNLGVGVRVTDSPEQCPRFFEVRGEYHYYPDSSDSEDYAQYTIVSNTGRRSTRIDPAGLERLGVGANRLLGDPAAVILDAAEALPLLAQEAGAAEGPVPEPSVTGTPLPVEEGGSDFLRDRWVLLVISGSFLLAAAGTVVLGLVVSRMLDKLDKPEKPEQRKKPGKTGQCDASDPNSRVDRPLRRRRRRGRGD